MENFVLQTDIKNEAHCHNHCGVYKTLKIIGSKWTMLILHNLFDGTKRFGELQRALKPISPKTLSQRLQELEKYGILKRKVALEEIYIKVILLPGGCQTKAESCSEGHF